MTLVVVVVVVTAVVYMPGPRTDSRFKNQRTHPAQNETKRFTWTLVVAHLFSAQLEDATHHG